MSSRGLVIDNARQAVIILLKALRIKHTYHSIEWLFYHPLFPSLLAMSKLFNRLNLKHSVIEVSSEDLQELPTPFLTHFRVDGGGFFIVVDEVNDENIKFINEKGSHENMPKSDFLSNWTAIAVIFDTQGHEKEANFVEHRIKQKIKSTRGLALIFSVVLTVSFIVYNVGLKHFQSFILLFLVTKTIGLVTSFILLIQTFDEKSTFFQKACAVKDTNSKINCSSVLESKGAKMFGVISWSEIGFIYFLTLALYLLVWPGKSVDNLIQLISVLITPYTAYSIWYQKFVVNAWCKLCLIIQGVLLLDCAISLASINWGEFHVLKIDIFILALLGMLLTSAYSYLKPIINAYIKAPKAHLLLNQLKFDNEIFNILSKRAKPFMTDQGLNPIIFGNREGKHKLTIISNPVCKPCQKAHKELFELLNYSANTVLHEVFITGNDTTDEAYKTALLILKLREVLSPKQFSEEINLYYDSFYLNPQNWRRRFDYLALENLELDDTLIRHNKWCEAHRVSSTPIILYNDRIIPKIFSIRDLNYIVD